MVQGLPTWNVPAAQTTTGVGAVGAGVGHVLQVTGHRGTTIPPYAISLHIVAAAAQFGANPPEPASTSAVDASMHGASAGAGAGVGGAGVGHTLQVTGHIN